MDNFANFKTHKGFSQQLLLAEAIRPLTLGCSWARYWFIVRMKGHFLVLCNIPNLQILRISKKRTVSSPGDKEDDTSEL